MTIFVIGAVGYLLVLIGISLYKMKKVKSHEDFIIAGRTVPVYMLIGTLVCTWIGSGSLFGTSGLAFRSGFSTLWFSAGAWLGLIIVYFIASRVRNISQYTLTDILEKRFNKSARIFGTITIIIAYLIITGYQFKGGGRILNIISNGSISIELGTLISCGFIIVFTMLAGMVSIVSIDIVSGIMKIIAILVAIPLGIEIFGGWDGFITQIEVHQPTYLDVLGDHDVIWAIGIMLPTFLLLLSESSMYQKFSAAKDAKAARNAVMGMLIGIIVIEIAMCLLAVIGYALYCEDIRFISADGKIVKEMAEQVILRIATEKIAPIAGVFIIAAAVSIITSTGNTFLMVTSTNIVRDLISQFKTFGDKQIITVQRVCIIIVGIAAYLLVTQFETILEMALISYTMIGASLTPAILATFFWKRLTSKAGVPAIISGMLVTLIFAVSNKIMAANKIEYLWNIFNSGITLKLPIDTDYIAIPAFLISLSTLIIVSLSTKPDDGWKYFIKERK